MKSGALFTIGLFLTGVRTLCSPGCASTPGPCGPDQQVRYVARWDVQDSGVSDDLYAVAFVNSKIGWAVGESNTILKTTDGGKKWQRLVERKENGPKFEDVLFTSPTEGWVKGQAVLLHTADGGESFDRPAAPLDSYGPCAACGSTFYQMPVPRLGAHVYPTSDGGKTWETLTGELPSNAFEAICFVDPMHGWLARDGGHTAITDDGGASWTTVDVPNGGDFTRIQFMTPQIGWIMPHSGHGGSILATTDGGKTWTGRYVGVESSYSLIDMRFLNEKNGFLLAEEKGGYQCLRTDTGGVKWTTVGRLKLSKYLNALSFPDTTHGWVVGAKGYFVHYHLVPVTPANKQ